MTQSFKQKVQSMKFSDIMQAMIDGLKKEHVKVNLETFGDAVNGVCYGCAATNIFCEISGKVFTPENISPLDNRHRFISESDLDDEFVFMFEDAIDDLRNTCIRYYNSTAIYMGFAPAPNAFESRLYELPALQNHNWRYELPKYQEVCDEIKKAGF